VPERKLSKNVPLPLSHQLLEILRDLILKGNYKAGQPFFTEKEIAEKYGVSRTTVREATSRLVYEGLLRRERGKGMFVIKPRVHEEGSFLLSYTEEVISRGMRPGSHLVEIQLDNSPLKIRNILQLNKSDKIIKLKRIRLADGEPMAIQTSYLPYTLCPEIYHGEYNWDTQSLTVALERLGLRIIKATQRVYSKVADGEDAFLLNINQGDPLLALERTCFLEDNTPVEYAIIYNRGDRWDFIMELKRKKGDFNETLLRSYNVQSNS